MIRTYRHTWRHRRLSIVVDDRNQLRGRPGAMRAARLAVAIEAVIAPPRRPRSIVQRSSVYCLVLFAGARDATDVFFQMCRGAFGSWFSSQKHAPPCRASPRFHGIAHRSSRAAPGLVVIGGEGAWSSGRSPPSLQPCSFAGAAPGQPLLRNGCRRAASVGGGMGRLRGSRSNVKAGSMRRRSACSLNFTRDWPLQAPGRGPMRDPAGLNKPSTRPIGGKCVALGFQIQGWTPHWGLIRRVAWLASCRCMACATALRLHRQLENGGEPTRGLQLSGVAVHRIVLSSCVSKRERRTTGLAGMARWLPCTAPPTLH